ncbi:MAG: P-loop NTPase [Gemmatimonadetes bacterium]|jgi:flagellar biosynthesis protein FlhG|nr:P-loop NTPase [Gemmatimonadota bacterium]
MTVQLRPLPSPRQAMPAADESNVIVLDTQAPSTVIWPVAGGKGGTGKSTLTANLGLGLSLLGYKVILVDGDLGGADLHLFFNQVSPPRSLSTFLTRDVEHLRDVLLPTPNENLRLACGGSELVGMANLSHGAKTKLIRHIKKLDADFVLIDLGAGSAYNTLDIFTLADDGIVVCTPEPQARVDAYGFIKNTVYRKLRRLFRKNEPVTDVIGEFAREAGRRSGRVADLLCRIGDVDPIAMEEGRQMLSDYRPRLLLNRVRSRRHIDEVERFVSLVREYLSTELEYVGYVRNDDKILDACERRRPVMLTAPKSAAASDVYNILMNGLGVPDRLHRFEPKQHRKLAQVAKAEAKFW